MKTEILLNPKTEDVCRKTTGFEQLTGGPPLKSYFRKSLRAFTFLMLCTAFAWQPAMAQSHFELDGDATSVLPNPPDDWDLVYNGTSSAAISTGVITDGFGASETSFTQGSKDGNDIPNWAWTNQSVPDKDDILHAGVVLYDRDKICFFADRYAVNGDAQMGIWIFKSSVSLNPDGSFNGIHTVGDILLLSNFTGGGGTSTIRVYEWVGSGGSDGALNELVLGTTYTAITNSTVVPSPWPYTPKQGPSGFFPVGAFIEG